MDRFFKEDVSQIRGYGSEEKPAWTRTPALKYIQVIQKIADFGYFEYAGKSNGKTANEIKYEI